MITNKNNKLGLVALISICVGSMIGAGLFDLPQNIAYQAGIKAILIGWSITFLGMISLAGVFRNLSIRCPDLDAGIYAYAKAGLGDYFGFSSAWGYWLSVWIGNVGYLIMVSASLALFFPIFGDGTSWASVVLSSIIIWSVTFLCLRGIKSAALVNMVVTGVKIIPIIFFIGVVFYAFKADVFVANLHHPVSLGPIPDQIRNMMLITVWVFIGIEGANVFSAYAKKRKDIGKATIISFLIIFTILFGISLLPFGVLKQAELAALNNPSTGSVLAYIIGGWGNKFMNIALIIAVLGAFLPWVLIAAEVPFIAGKKDGLFPRVFAIENKVDCPAGALIITAVCAELYLVFVHFYNIGYLTTIMIAVAMILPPYLFSAVYALLLAKTGKSYESSPLKERRWDFIISLVAVMYGFWLLYAARKYLLLSSILYLIGGIIFIISRKRQGKKVFRLQGMILFLAICVLSAISIIALVTGQITF